MRHLPRTSSLPPSLLALLGYTSLAVLLFINTWADPRASHPGVPGDPEMYCWTMLWGPFSLSHLHNPFFTTYLLYPRGANLMWNAPPLPGLLMWPVSALLGIVVSYNVLATMSLALSAWCMFLALRRLVSGQLGPLVGGLFYGFSPFMIGQSLGHIMLTLAPIPPLLVLVLHEALVRQRWAPWRTGVALGALAAAQLMSFQETLAGELLAAGIGVTVLAAFKLREVRPRLPYAARCLGFGLASFLVIAAPALRTMFLGAQRLTEGTVHPPNIFVNDLLGFFLPTPLQLMSPGAVRDVVMGFTGNLAEWNNYLGVPLMVLIVLATVLLRRRLTTVRVAALSAFLLALLSLGPRLHVGGITLNIRTPGLVLAHLPLMGHLLPSRLSLMMDVFVAIVMAAFVEAACRPNRMPLRLGALALTVVALVPLVPAVPFWRTAVSVPPFFTGRAVERIPEGSVALVAPYAGTGTGYASELWQAEGGFRYRLTDGYMFIPGPGGVIGGPPLTATASAMLDIAAGKPRPVMTGSLRTTMRADLTAVHVRSAIVGPMPYSDEMVRFFGDLLQRPPERVDGVFLWSDVRLAAEPRSSDTGEGPLAGAPARHQVEVAERRGQSEVTGGAR